MRCLKYYVTPFISMSLLVHLLYIQPFFPRESRMSIKQFDPCKINGSKVSQQDAGACPLPSKADS